VKMAQRIATLLNEARSEQAAFEQEIEDHKSEIRELRLQRMRLNQALAAVSRQLAAATTPAEHNQLALQNNQLIAELGAATDRLNLLQSQSADPKIQQEFLAKVSQRRADYIHAVVALRKLVDSAKRQYAEFAKDENIKSALAALT